MPSWTVGFAVSILLFMTVRGTRSLFLYSNVWFTLLKLYLHCLFSVNIFFNMTWSVVSVTTAGLRGFLSRVSLGVIPRLFGRVSCCCFSFYGMKATLDSAYYLSSRLSVFLSIEEPVYEAAVVALVVLQPHYE